MAAGAREAGGEEAGYEGAAAVTAKAGAAVSVVGGEGKGGGRGVAGEGVTVKITAAFVVTPGSQQPANRRSSEARSMSTSPNNRHHSQSNSKDD